MKTRASRRPVSSLQHTAIWNRLRRGEIFALEVKDVDLRAGTVVVPSGKTAEPRRRVLLGGECLQGLRTWVDTEELADGDPLLGSVTPERLREAWEHIRSQPGLEDVRFHDLRHTHAVHWSRHAPRGTTATPPPRQHP